MVQKKEGKMVLMMAGLEVSTNIRGAACSCFLLSPHQNASESVSNKFLKCVKCISLLNVFDFPL